MSTSVESVVLRPVPDLRWVDDARSVTLVSGDTGPTWTLRGIDAAVWTWMTVPGGAGRLVELVAGLTGSDAEEAARVVAALLARWRTQGLLELAPDRGAG